MSVGDTKSGVRDADALLLVGIVGRPHGVRGDVKVVPETDDPGRLADVETLFVGAAAATAAPWAVQAVRLQQTKRGPTAVVKLAGVDTREAAEALRRQRVFAAEDDLPALADDEYFLHDLVGMEVVVEDGAAVGTVRDVLQLPAHDVLVVARPDRADAMIPVVPEFADVDVGGGRVVVRPIEGMLE